MTTDLYKIGVVSKRTGVSLERLRSWERRHGFAPEARSGNIRYYSEDQVRRISKFKSLIDAGHAIGQLTDLSDEELDHRIEETLTHATSSSDSSQILLIGENLDGVGAALSRFDEFDDMIRLQTVRELRGNTIHASVAAIVFYQSSLKADEVRRIVENTNALVVVMYRYFSDHEVEATNELDCAIFEVNEVDPDDIALYTAQSVRQKQYRTSKFTSEELQLIDQNERSGHDGLLSARDVLRLLKDVNELEQHVVEHAQSQKHMKILGRLHEARTSLEEALSVSVEADQLLVPSNASIFK